tara:strand:+ start:158 stop:733 length:576 start_codon:yes stop_codon:yes gene_type:complete
MGFDLYGLNPKGDIPKPVITDWKDDSISFEEQMKAYQSYQNDTPGSYFRANVWWWRPIWQYISITCEDILTEKDMEKGEYNDGHKISKTKANRIASRLKLADKNGEIMKYESEYKAYLKSLPEEDCSICEGTGVREDEIGREAREKDEEYKCNGCYGKGKRESFGTHYPFESEEVMRFAEFCEQSGGFEIC